MNGHAFTLAETDLVALPSGALWWPAERSLIVADLHLAKSSNTTRRHGAMLPPYEAQDTLARLARDMAGIRPARVICLGDSFDDSDGCAELDPSDEETLAHLQQGAEWLWIEGNHDREATPPGGTVAVEFFCSPLTFRHIAQGQTRCEISGHFHPKARLSIKGKAISRPCFLYDEARVILPAYGTSTGGLDWAAPALRSLFPGPACAVLTGLRTVALPVPAPAEAVPT